MSFEKAFSIPEQNTLKQTKFTQKGTLAQDEYWLHEEYDPDGNLIATYESWHLTSIKPPFNTNSGYKKFDENGELVEESENLEI